ncbi:MAG TPA: dihydrolipoamide acetyltransferase family protein [Acidimicrobiales bacterium]|nr:dihydrolipoamide acetyltransferase family protein [Acidimicrobiales bacterium]
MSRRQFNLPDLGEGLTEAEIVTWLVAAGDTITLNQVIAEVETEKAVVELPSPYAGTVVALLAEAGTVVDVGRPIIEVEMATEAATLGEPTEEKVQVLVGYGPAEAPVSRRHRRNRGGAETATPAVAPPLPAGSARPLATPPVRYMARVAGIDLTQVAGTGPGGTITRDDVRALADVGAVTATPLQPPSAGVSPGGDQRETRVPIRGVRKHTADAMVRSAFSAPHVTEFVTVDVTPMVELVDALRQHQAFDGVRVTPLAVIAKALLLALEQNPSLNSSWDEEGQQIVTKHYVNLGIAAATPRGLVVPNIKEAHTMKLRQLAVALADLATTARAGRSTPADLSGGTITITNIGVFGVDGGTPIVNPGEAAILCVGAVRRQPWEFEEEIALRQVLTLSLSFDHRLVDGQEGSLFLASVASMLADPRAMLALS